MDHRNEWAKNEHNPDYNLVVLNAANKDFQSKCDTLAGSYFITKFVEKIKKNDEPKCCWRNKKWLSEIMGEIQVELHQRKQLPVFTFNNPQMKNIIFVKNKQGKYIDNDDAEVIFDTDEEKTGLNEDRNDQDNGREIELEKISEI